MQVLPLMAWLLMRSTARRRWSERQRVWLVCLAGLGYLGLIALLTWQALRGQSIIAPDLATWGALAMLIGALVMGVSAIWVLGRR
jgi:hypothetical protein